jgi:hypothetical protein
MAAPVLADARPAVAFEACEARDGSPPLRDGEFAALLRALFCFGSFCVVALGGDFAAAGA